MFTVVVTALSDELELLGLGEAYRGAPGEVSHLCSISTSLARSLKSPVNLRVFKFFGKLFYRN